MIWWYRNVFIDRSLPLTGDARYEEQPEIPRAESGFKRLLVKVFIWGKAKVQEKLQSHYDWKVYKNLSDHQLKDIGLTRDDLGRLLHNKTPLISPQRVKTVQKPEATKPQIKPIKNVGIAKPIEIPGDIVCCNDSEERVA